MKIKLTHSFIYDTEDKQLWDEFLEYQDDHPLTFPALQGFLIDRFINPYFDKAGKTTMEIVVDDV